MNNENQNIEYKESWRDEYVKWLCGFANAQGGKLYIGINDKGEVCGVDNAHKLSEDIPNKIVSFLGLVADVNILNKDGKDYVEIVVSPSNVPISFKGKYYVRSGSTLQELNGSTLTNFLLTKSNTTWDQSIVTEATLDDIDLDAVEYFAKRAVDARRLDESVLKLTTIQLFRKLKLVNKSDQLTIAALLLFGKDIEQWNLMSSFRIGRFRNTQDNLLMQDKIVCPLIKMPSNIMWTLRTRYLVAPIHYEGMQRIEPLEIPEDALREMVCNAIVHKDYSGPFIQMRVWDDRVELWNYGELPNHYTIDKLLQTHESFPRNPLIAQVFYHAGLIEQWGRGYEKIHDAFVREHLLQPTFEQVRGGFMATIKREKFIAINTGQHVETLGENKLRELVEGLNGGISEGISEGLSEGLNEGLNEGINEDVQRKLALVIGTIHDYPGIKTPAIVQRTDIPLKTLERYISQLRTWGIIEFRGAKKTGGYFAKL